MRPLFAVAVERLRGDKLVPDIVYIHAESPGHAKMQFMIAEPDRHLSRIVAVGPALGFHVEDRDGKVVSTD